MKNPAKVAATAIRCQPRAIGVARCVMLSGCLMRGKAYPPDMIALIVGRVVAGASYMAVSRATGIPKSTVQSLWRKHGSGDLSHRKKQNGQERLKSIDRWVADYKRGLSSGQIAHRDGVSAQVVRKALGRISPTGDMQHWRDQRCQNTQKT